MAKSQLEGVVSHWHKLVENFETSPREFYSSVEEALQRRGIPGLKTRRVVWNEGGVLSPKREYLRVIGGRHFFDMCAAPFGTGFFFSSWVSKRPPRAVFLAFLFLMIGAATIWQLLNGSLARVWSAAGPLVFIVANPFVTWFLTPLVAFAVTLWLVAMLARVGLTGLELAVLAIPLIGLVYERIFVPVTYYRLDTMLMFQSAVQAAMLEAINGAVTQKGLRALSEKEAKPLFSELVGAAESRVAALQG